MATALRVYFGGMERKYRVFPLRVISPSLGIWEEVDVFLCHISILRECEVSPTR
jgi:hypothetical protein